MHVITAKQPVNQTPSAFERLNNEIYELFLHILDNFNEENSNQMDKMNLDILRWEGFKFVNNRLILNLEIGLFQIRQMRRELFTDTSHSEFRVIQLAELNNTSQRCLVSGGLIDKQNIPEPLHDYSPKVPLVGNVRQG